MEKKKKRFKKNSVENWQALQEEFGIRRRQRLLILFGILLFGQVLVMGESIAEATKFDNIILLLVMLCSFLFLGYRQISSYNTIKNIRLYHGIVVNRNISDIEQIAKIVGKTPQKVERIIRDLISKGRLDAFFDESTGKVLSLAVQEVEHHTLLCAQCGGSTTIAGDFGHCDYCGSAIAYKN